MVPPALGGYPYFWKMPQKWVGTNSSLGGCCTTCLAFLPECLQPLCQAGGDVEGIFRLGIQDPCPHPCVRFAAQQQQAVETVALQRVQVIEVGYL